VVALTKCDLVDDPEWLELVREEVRERLATTTLAAAPIIPCSALTGQGLPELLAALDASLAPLTAAETEAGKAVLQVDQRRPRLPVDRVFSITGFGTVVTGTLQDGPLRIGQEVQIYPGNQRARVRTLQAHKQSVEEGKPGGRLAANLAGVAKNEIARGDVLALPGTLLPTIALDAHLEVIAGTPRPLPHNAELELYVGAAEVPVRVLLLNQAEIRPGAAGWAQLRLKRPLALLRGDRFILRVPSPSMTIGGGEVVEPWARRHRRYDPSVIHRLEQLAEENPDMVVLATLQPSERRRGKQQLKRSQSAEDRLRTQLGGYSGYDLQHIGQTTALPVRQVEETVRQLEARREVVRAGSLIMVSSEWERLRTDATELLSAYHQRYPLRTGMPREEWRSRLQLEPHHTAEILVKLASEGVLTEEPAVHLPDHHPRMTSSEADAAAAVLERFQREPFNPPTRPEVDEQLGSELTLSLMDQGKLVRVSDSILLAPDAYARAVDSVVSYLRVHDTITVAQARDLLDTSRKYMLAILEHFDERRITRRRGDDRILGPNAPTSSGIPGSEDEGR
jgi:selenocysteine-specific elongation factor